MKPMKSITEGNVITSIFAVVLYNYPRSPRWSPRCLSPLAPNQVFLVGYYGNLGHKLQCS